MQVRDVMTPSVVTVSREDSTETAAKIMGRYGIGAVPVISGEEICGILTDRDIVPVSYTHLWCHVCFAPIR